MVVGVARCSHPSDDWRSSFARNGGLRRLDHFSRQIARPPRPIRGKSVPLMSPCGSYHQRGNRVWRTDHLSRASPLLVYQRSAQATRSPDLPRSFGSLLRPLFDNRRRGDWFPNKSAEAMHLSRRIPIPKLVETSRWQDQSCPQDKRCIHAVTERPAFMTVLIRGPLDPNRVPRQSAIQRKSDSLRINPHRFHDRGDDLLANSYLTEARRQAPKK